MPSFPVCTPTAKRSACLQLYYDALQNACEERVGELHTRPAEERKKQAMTAHHET